MILLVALAHAGTSADQLALPPGDDVADPLTVWRPEVQVPGSWSVTATLEEAQGLLSVYTVDAQGSVTKEDLVSDLAGLHLALGLAPSKRFAFAVAVPIWLTSAGDLTSRQGPALGDLLLSVPVGLILPKLRDRGFGLSVIPRLSAPTGDASRYLGSGGWTGGAQVAIGGGLPRWQIATNAGLATTAEDALLGKAPGVALLGSLAGTWSPSDVFAIHLEGLGRYGLAAADAADLPSSPTSGSAKDCASSKGLAGTTVDCGGLRAAVGSANQPAELILDFDWAPTPGLQWGAGGSLGLNDAVGAPTWRGFVDVGWTVGKQKPDHSTTTGKIKVDADIDDLNYDGTGTGGITATVRPDSQVRIEGETWLDAENNVVGHGTTLKDVPPAPYTIEIRYNDGKDNQTERHTWEIGYDVRWRPLAADASGARTSDDDRTVTSSGEALARSYNRSPGGQREWVEVESADGSVGLARSYGWPADQPDVGWTEDKRTDGAPRAPGRLGVEAEDKTAKWSVDREEAGTSSSGDTDPLVAATAVKNGAVVKARASFPMTPPVAGSVGWSFVEGATIESRSTRVILEMPSGPWTLTVQDEEGAIVFTRAGDGGEAEVRLPRSGIYTLDVTQAGAVSTMTLHATADGAGRSTGTTKR